MGARYICIGRCIGQQVCLCTVSCDPVILYRSIDTRKRWTERSSLFQSRSAPGQKKGFVGVAIHSISVLGMTFDPGVGVTPAAERRNVDTTRWWWGPTACYVGHADATLLPPGVE